MNDDHLSVYLNDHLAGAVAAIELVQYCREHNPSGPLNEALSRLLVQIEEDHDVLKDLQSRVHGRENALKTTISWLFSKLSRLKLENILFRYDDLTRLEELEGLLVGIRGKLALWSALEATAPSDGRFDDIDFAHLQQRARQQLELAEHHHVKAAVWALA